MSTKIFPTAQDAQNAFYEALERCELEAMMALWSEDEEIAGWRMIVHHASPAPEAAAPDPAAVAPKILH